MLPDSPHGRPLTAMERMRLDELARRLSDDDPRLAQALRDGATGPDTSGEQPRRPEMRRVVMGGAALVVLAVLVAGMVGLAAVALTLIVVLGVRAVRRRTRRPR
ncbi:DUF3040 domain-containing protein [Pseudonocardia xinjiangensis]|uniref:DUF3040 domain-containing protein n=1 Tax=Pseudonocardia xinjiangensis TaxID=75289 RepID=UPI003D93ED29